MILPTKRLSEPRSLLGMGAIILGELSKPRDLSGLWEDTKRAYSADDRHGMGPQSFTYEWFVLALDFLYLMDAIVIEDGRVRKLPSPPQLKEPVPHQSDRLLRVRETQETR